MSNIRIAPCSCTVYINRLYRSYTYRSLAVICTHKLMYSLQSIYGRIYVSIMYYNYTHIYINDALYNEKSTVYTLLTQIKNSIHPILITENKVYLTHFITDITNSVY